MNALVHEENGHYHTAQTKSDTIGNRVVRILGWDVIHAIYNLFYPAVLGAFIYELITSSLPKARHLIPSFVPPVEERSATVESIIATASLLVVFSIDFMLAKKLYVKLANALNGHIGLLAIMESILVVFAALAFSSCHGAVVNWRYYFAWLLFAVVLIGGFYLVMGWALKKSYINSAITRRLLWSLSLMLVGCILGIALTWAGTALWTLPFIAVYVAICAVVYGTIGTYQTGLDFPLSISGNNLDNPE